MLADYTFIFGLALIFQSCSLSSSSHFRPPPPPPQPHGPSLYRLTKLSHAFGHGEGPTWDERLQRLLFVDMFGPDAAVHSYAPATGQWASMYFAGTVTAVFTVAGATDLFVVALDRRLMGVEWAGGVSDGYRRTELAEVEGDKPGNRFNDGKVDRNGRIWIGTMGAAFGPGVAGITLDQGSVYRVNAPYHQWGGKPTLDPELVITPVSISNGIAWNRANTVMYYIDTSSYKVMAYNYDAETGNIDTDRCTIAFDFKTDQNEVDGGPDGMTIDRDDNIWVALYGGGCIVHINPRERKLLQIIPIPARDVTSVSFGGARFNTLYVTTSRHDLTESEKRFLPGAGALYSVEGLAVGGFPATHTNVISRQTMQQIECHGQSKEKGDLWCQGLVSPKKRY